MRPHSGYCPQPGIPSFSPLAKMSLTLCAHDGRRRPVRQLICIKQIVLMLSIIRNDQRITLRFNGRLVGSCAEDFNFLMSTGTALDVDLGGLTCVDHAGEQLLVRLREMGATFHGAGLFAHRLRRKLLWRGFGLKSVHL